MKSTCRVQPWKHRFFSTAFHICVLCVVVLTAAVPVVLPAQQDTTSPPAVQRRILLSGFAASVFGLGSPDFATEYRKLGGAGFSFDPPLSLGVSTRIALTRNLWGGASAEGYRAHFQDSYFQDITRTDGFDTLRGFRNIYQDMQLKVLPVFITLDYAPVQAQFRTYAGVGLGLAYTEVYWFESVSSSFPQDNRRGGLHVEEQRFAPAARVHARMELGFDRPQREEGAVLHSVYVEARYTWIPVSLPLLRNVAGQTDEPPQRWQDSFTLQAGGLALAVGVSLQFVQ